ncbi:MAG: hypothetical protein WAV45_11255 [Propionibacteriaceae bacterium]|nr:hypothetical protein [Micropruina sp.]HBY23438.1 hypothetical protein [Propionibacteriaceae bacterium]
MAFIADLAAYDYYPVASEALAVGWLDGAERFETGACPSDVTERLKVLASAPVRLMRGYHYCQFCEHSAPPPKLLRADINLYEAPDVPRGNGEVWLTSPDGTNYAAPVLIVHYIEAHAYLPPARFINAVRFGVPTEGLS